MKARLEFKPADCWVGVYTEKRRRLLPHSPTAAGCDLSYGEHGVIERHVWICLLPMLPIHLSWRAR